MIEIPYVEHLSEEQVSRLKLTLDQVATEEEAWHLFAAELLGPSAVGENPRDRVLRSWQRVRAKIHPLICNDPRMNWFLDSHEGSDALAIAMLVTGRLAADETLGIDVVALGVLVVRIGLRRVCEETSGTDDPA